MFGRRGPEPASEFDDLPEGVEGERLGRDGRRESMSPADLRPATDQDLESVDQVTDTLAEDGDHTDALLLIEDKQVDIVGWQTAERAREVLVADRARFMRERATNGR